MHSGHQGFFSDTTPELSIGAHARTGAVSLQALGGGERSREVPHRGDQAMGRLVKFNVVDEAGTAAPGQTIMVGDNESKTSSTGIAQALLDDGDTALLVNGVEVYRGAVAALRPIEIFTTRGQ